MYCRASVSTDSRVATLLLVLGNGDKQFWAVRKMSFLTGSSTRAHRNAVIDAGMQHVTGDLEKLILAVRHARIILTRLCEPIALHGHIDRAYVVSQTDSKVTQCARGFRWWSRLFTNMHAPKLVRRKPPRITLCSMKGAVLFVKALFQRCARTQKSVDMVSTVLVQACHCLR